MLTGATKASDVENKLIDFIPTTDTTRGSISHPRPCPPCRLPVTYYNAGVYIRSVVTAVVATCTYKMMLILKAFGRRPNMVTNEKRSEEGEGESEAHYDMKFLSMFVVWCTPNYELFPLAMRVDHDELSFVPSLSVSLWCCQ